MKHIKSYKLFENNTIDIKNHIKDILYELWDHKYATTVEYMDSESVNLRSYEVSLFWTVGEYIKYDKIVNPVNHVIDYMTDNGYKSYITVWYPVGSQVFKNIDSIKGESKNIEKIVITFISNINEGLFENNGTRTSPLTEEEFIDLVHSNCSQFSFNNDMLYRGCGDIGEYALYKGSPRKNTYGTGYSYHTFFNQRKEYPVARYKSIIGSTSVEHAGVLGQHVVEVYLVIPYDNSKIIFCPTPDMASGGLGRNKGMELSDEMFSMQEYCDNFKINYDALQYGKDKLSTSKMESEFFTDSNCLLYKLGGGEYSRNKQLVTMNGKLELNKSLLDERMDYLKNILNK